MSYQPQMQTVVVNLTAAQIKSLHATPVLIVPGVSGAFLDVRSVWIQYNPGSTPFGTININDVIALVSGTDTAGGNLISTNDGTGLQATGMVDQSVKMGTWQLPQLIPINSIPNTNTTSGQGLFLTQYTVFSYPSGVDWTVGNGNMTVVVRFAYVEV